ncbi:endoglucanase E-4 [Anabrus simplex]|uniref:endoglucanase E-4 n=1 Tax=Anabrus simplex TaxID=316456 RepID=UPI0034DD5BEF
MRYFCFSLILVSGVVGNSNNCDYKYAEVLYKSLLFYQAQRSGKLCFMDPLVSWRKDSAIDDCGRLGEDLSGGYYDGGGYVKFGFPMAFTTTMLSWGVISYEHGYCIAGQLDEAKRAIRWATDYFLKCHANDSVLYGQVGDPQIDNECWGRPEDMTMERPAYYIDAANPGSDLAAETAAALAAASIVFLEDDPNYSKTLRTHAATLYKFADKFRAIYSDSIPCAGAFYRSTGFGDELVWAATWLFKATGRLPYLIIAEQMYQEFGLGYTSGFSWDEKRLGVDVLLAEIKGRCVYMDKLQDFCDTMLTKKERTPKGLLFLGEWGSLRNAAYVAFILMKAADLGLNSVNYRHLAKSQIDYMLGNGGRSYVVGFGNNPPTHCYHRSSSCPDEPYDCNWDTFRGCQPNAHILYGALVGGPGPNDSYSDIRTDTVHNSVALDYNAGFQGVLAGLIYHGFETNNICQGGVCRVED